MAGVILKLHEVGFRQFVHIDLNVATLTAAERQQLAEQLRAVAQQIA